MRDELNLIIDKLKERTCDKNNVVKEITIEPQTVYCRVYNSVSIEDKTNLLRNTAIEAMKAHGTDVTRRMYFTEYSEEAPEQISYCVAVPPESEGENILRSPMLRAICLFHHGAYEDIPKARERLVLYAKEHDLKLAGIFRNLYLEGPPQHKDKSRFVTQVIAMIE